MKKRVLSMLLAFILCFSTLPMTAFAQNADVVTEREEQQEADSAEEQEEEQEADSAEEQEKQQEAVPVTEQKKAEAAAAPGEETSSDKKSTTAGEAPGTVEPSVESVSDSDAGTQDTSADDEKKAAVQKVQALIDALPETVTEENAERVSEQLERRSLPLWTAESTVLSCVPRVWYPLLTEPGYITIMFPKNMTSEAVSRKSRVRSVSSVPNWTRTSWQNCSASKLAGHILHVAGTVR